MKRRLTVLAILLVLVACATWIRTPLPPIVGGPIVLEAQALPINAIVAWTANPTSDQVLNYIVRLDGVIVGSPTGIEQPITITTAGIHTITVVAVNLWATSPPGTLVVDVRVPGSPGGLAIRRVP